MLTTVAVLLLLTAIVGAAMATLVFVDRSVPMLLPLLHAVLAIPALVLAVIAILHGVTASANLMWAAVSLFGLAVIGGLMLVRQHLRKAGQSNGLATSRGAAAIVGLVLVLVVLGMGMPVV
ncbi:MAG: hypothetical protein FJ125_01365 [Deltaproteobacteria bacterium]|nr:hypothetical protein [Deltaproteobacteria bacterium]